MIYSPFSLAPSWLTLSLPLTVTLLALHGTPVTSSESNHSASLCGTEWHQCQGRGGAPLQRHKRSLLMTQILTTVEAANNKGYPAELHSVTTEDGYVLGIHRIPHGIQGVTAGTRPVILLMHCRLCSSIDFLLNDPNKALGFVLADAGYDVWMANARGNPFSRKHVSLSPKKRQFWLHSWHEIGKYDLAATIDKVIAVTGAAKISYLGFSSAAAELLVLLSEKPEYNDKLKVAALLAPAAYRTYTTASLFKIFSRFVDYIELFANIFHLYEITIRNKLFNTVTTTLCSPANRHLNPLCFALFNLILNVNINKDLVNRDFLPVVVTHTPAGGSVRTMTHAMQVKNAGEFQQYDYGRHTNLKVYGSDTPPRYDIQKTVIPVGLFTGRADEYVAKADSDRLARELPNLVKNFEVSNLDFAHFDFLWSKDVDTLLNGEVLSFLNLFV